MNERTAGVPTYHPLNHTHTQSIRKEVEEGGERGKMERGDGGKEMSEEKSVLQYKSTR